MSAHTPTDDDADHMVKISDLISRLQKTKDQFGDTCVYIRRGGLAWGAVALNRRDDDKKHGVFDLQAQHDRDMLQRAGQVERLIASRRAAEVRVAEAADQIEALVKALEGIAEFSSADATTLGAIARLVSIRNTALRALATAGRGT